MINNRLELIKGGEPKALLTWHMPREDGLFYPIAFQFADDLDEVTQRSILDIASQPLAVPAKQYKRCAYGSSDHFSVLARPLARLGFHTRVFGPAQHGHALADRPIVQP